MHRARDHEGWKAVYDSVRELQREGGVRFHQVLRSTEDPNLVVAIRAFDTRQAAEAFFANEDLKRGLEAPGVDLSSMRLEYFDEIEVGDI